MSRVIVVGSINQDVTVTVDRFPSPGETLSGTSLTYGLGGKGANQAAAAAHSGVPVFFVGAVGADPSGQRLRAELASHGVDVTHLREVNGPSGTALITVASSGENTIILDAGANATVTVEPAKASLFPAPADIVVLQAEIPEAANEEALTWAHSFGARVLLNLAPARPTDAAFMARVDVLVVNETEAGRTLPRPHPRRGRGHHGGRGRVRGRAGRRYGPRQALHRSRVRRHPRRIDGGPRAGCRPLVRDAPPRHARLNAARLPRLLPE